MHVVTLSLWLITLNWLEFKNVMLPNYVNEEGLNESNFHEAADLFAG